MTLNLKSKFKKTLGDGLTDPTIKKRKTGMEPLPAAPGQSLDFQKPCYSIWLLARCKITNKRLIAD